MTASEAATGNAEALVTAHGACKRYRVQSGWFKRSWVDAVRDVDLSIDRHEVMAVVGESGSGKSTLGRLLVGLIPPSSGEIRLNGIEMRHMHGARLRHYRRQAGIIFQNPYRSLNPRLTVGAALAEPLRVWDVVPRDEVRQEVVRLLELVGLSAAHAERYPHALSGGQRQRVAIARALSVRPEFLVADEAISSLDVSTAAEILNVLIDLHANLGLTMLFITHDLTVARLVATRVAVMSNGQIVEIGSPGSLYQDAEHPYTRRLLSSQLPILGS